MATLDRLRERVASIISDKGKTVTYAVKSESYSRTTGQSTTTSTEYSIKVTPPKDARGRILEAANVNVGDAFTSFADYGKPFDGDPEVGHTVTIDSKVWTIVAVMPVYSGELVAKWDLQLRR